jgi:hypothetical protein
MNKFALLLCILYASGQISAKIYTYQDFNHNDNDFLNNVLENSQNYKAGTMAKAEKYLKNTEFSSLSVSSVQYQNNNWETNLTQEQAQDFLQKLMSQSKHTQLNPNVLQQAMNNK